MGNSKPLVSIITPCYNAENYLMRYMESVLEQTYDNIEFILVNDGSDDNTQNIALSYEKKFKDRGYIYIYIYMHKNSGQAAAINKGLKIMKGKYLVWADSDDILDKDNIKLKVEYLENHPDKGLVAARCQIVNENNLNKILRVVYNKADNNWHENLVFGSNVTNACGIYMIRVEFLFNIYKNRKIFESRAGQNWQLLIPMTYFYSYGKIDDVLYTIVERANSHSRKYRDIYEIMSRYDELNNILIEVSKFFDKNYREEYLYKARLYYYRVKFITSIQYDNEDITNMCYKNLKLNNICSTKDNMKYWRYRLKMLFVKMYKRIL